MARELTLVMVLVILLMMIVWLFTNQPMNSDTSHTLLLTTRERQEGSKREKTVHVSNDCRRCTARAITHEWGRRSCKEEKRRAKNGGIFTHNNSLSDDMGQQFVDVVTADSSPINTGVIISSIPRLTSGRSSVAC